MHACDRRGYHLLIDALRGPLYSVYGDSVLAAQRRVSRRQVDGAEALQPPAAARGRWRHAKHLAAQRPLQRARHGLPQLYI